MRMPSTPLQRGAGCEPAVPATGASTANALTLATDRPGWRLVETRATIGVITTITVATATRIGHGFTLMAFSHGRRSAKAKSCKVE
jgi:hypothetical protein